MLAVFQQVVYLSPILHNFLCYSLWLLLIGVMLPFEDLCIFVLWYILHFYYSSKQWFFFASSWFLFIVHCCIQIIANWEFTLSICFLIEYLWTHFWIVCNVPILVRLIFSCTIFGTTAPSFFPSKLRYFFVNETLYNIFICIRITKLHAIYRSIPGINLWQYLQSNTVFCN